MASLCRSPTPETSVFCNKQNDINGFWGIYMGTDVTAPNYRALDARSLSYLLQNPGGMVIDFLSGLWYGSNFPAGASNDPPYSSSPLKRFIDLSTWIVLLLGLRRKDTMLLSATALGLWIIPGIGNVFGLYSSRYHRPIAGIPLALALLIAVALYKSRVSGGGQRHIA